MHPGDTILRELILLLAVSLPITFLFHKMRLPALVGFIITGIILGPHGAAMITDTTVVERLAEIGVVLLLFTIGLEFSIEDIMSSGRQFITGGGMQVLATIAAVSGIAMLFGFSIAHAVFFGFLSSLSSTAIVLKMYSDRVELDSVHGRLATGILLFQDMAVIPMILMLPVLAQAAGEGGVSPLSVAATLAKAVLGLVGVFLTARRIVPYLLHHVIKLRNREILFLLVVLLCLGTAWITYSLGLSLALGAFLAGLIISESEYSHDIVSNIMPFRDYFASIFFISIGMLLQTGYFASHWILVISMTCALVIVKTILVVLTARALLYPMRSAILSGLGLAQIGEFSFLLAQQGADIGLIKGDLYQLFVDTSILSMLVTPLMVQIAPFLTENLPAGPFTIREEKKDICSLTGHTIIAGYGLNGRNLAKTLKATHIPYVVVEVNAETIRRARADGEPIIYGDITREETFIRAGAPCAKALVLAISDYSAARIAVRMVRRINPSIFILVRTRYAAEVDELVKIGADQVIPEEFETSVEIFSRVLHQYHIPNNIIANQINLIRSEGYSMLRGVSLKHERIERVAAMLAGTTVDTFQVQPDYAAVGRTLQELDIRRYSGATVIAIARKEEAITNPGPDIRIEVEDILVLMGSHKELDQAVSLLRSGKAGR